MIRLKTSLTIVALFVLVGCAQSQAGSPVIETPRTLAVTPTLVPTVNSTSTPRPSPTAAATRKPREPSPTPTAKERFCVEAAKQIELMIEGKHPNQENFRVSVRKKAKISQIRPGEDPNTCLGVVRLSHISIPDRGVESRRITFSRTWFRAR